MLEVFIITGILVIHLLLAFLCYTLMKYSLFRFCLKNNIRWSWTYKSRLETLVLSLLPIVNIPFIFIVGIEIIFNKFCSYFTFDWDNEAPW